MSHSGDFAPTLILGAPPPQPPQPPQQAFQPPPQKKPPEPEPLSFTGTGGEYFRIWIVNLLLTIVTCGIYSAWAKVRKLRYFYGSTHLASSSFEYHGNPIAILKGRVIAVGLLIAYYWAPKISIFAGFAMVALLGLVMPWLIWKSLQFKLHNSSYRGIRFGFGGTVWLAYYTYLILPVLSAFTGNLLAPFVHQRIKKFQHEESRFGRDNFAFHATVGSFYKVYLIALGIFIVGTIAIVLMSGGLFSGLKSAGGLKRGGASVMTSIFLFMAVIYLWAYTVYSIFTTMLQNLIWSNTSLDRHQFISEMKWTTVVFITLTNAIAIVLTLGLFTPFAKVRMLKYRVESVTMIPGGALDDFFADSAADVSATGEGVTDLLDFDFAL